MFSRIDGEKKTGDLIEVDAHSLLCSILKRSSAERADLSGMCAFRLELFFSPAAARVSAEAGNSAAWG